MVQVVEMPRAGRVNRRPTHTFYVQHKPWEICPFVIAPVLPGETLKNLLLQSRAVSDPIVHPLLGWHLEYYLFYVKHRDLDARAHYESMMLEYGYDLSSQTVAANTVTYHPGGTLNWVQQCRTRVTETYFRDEGEAAGVATINGQPAAKISHPGWWDSVMDDTVFDEGTGPSGGETLQELDQLRSQWEFMRANQLTNMSYEDFLRTYGVRMSKVELHKPELIRYVREWTYPTNHIDPTTGAPSSAVSWAIAERADKDRFFTEPGFIFGVTVARPKVYCSNQKGAGVSMLDNALTWLPAIMRDDPATSLRQYANGTGPLQSTTNGYWVDVRDLFLYGDQFFNVSGAVMESIGAAVGLPTAALEKKYPTDAMAESLFTTEGTDYWVKQDGVVSLTIAGTQVDHT